MAQLKGIIHRTPLKTSSTLNNETKKQLFLKMENEQKTGAFKVRGASYKIAKLSSLEASRGVIAASAGNHAQGVALAAAKRGISAKIFMPAHTPKAKTEATEGYGAQIVLTGESFQEAYQAAVHEQKSSGATFVHPFDDYEVMTGQGTVAMEMLTEQPDLDTLIVPIGGGGLISGMAAAAKQLKPDIQVIGVQAEGAKPMRNAYYHNGPEILSSVNTIADGIAVKQPGQLTLPMIKKYVDGILTVNDQQVAETMIRLLERDKTLVEGAGAVALAAVRYHARSIKGRNCGVVVSGGNMDLSKLPHLQDLASPKPALAK
ncbi:threonine ammonia-lyase [Thalassobacillus sp. CUG 92003]|uniref:threonine ammonia-lyase n=1 Tax=Thalassobacillus sp. CUG 92003 TaxID=2736641 RepID=UPI0015E65CEA|nr:threonine ammonia-lyase [Thalassobacillus sp. CUG 92003]